MATLVQCKDAHAELTTVNSSILEGAVDQLSDNIDKARYSGSKWLKVYGSHQTGVPAKKFKLAGTLSRQEQLVELERQLRNSADVRTVIEEVTEHDYVPIVEFHVVQIVDCDNCGRPCSSAGNVVATIEFVVKLSLERRVSTRALRGV